MAVAAPQRSIFHITHVDNLASIIGDSALCSDGERIRLNKQNTNIGMTDNKKRRLRIPVPPHVGTMLGQYVPFNFCARSVMLFVIHKGNHVALSYRGGQDPIVHLEADLDAAITMARSSGRRWAFSDINASDALATFFYEQDKLDQLDWAAINAHNFQDGRVRSCKQAEFLVFEAFPWSLVHTVGVHTAATKAKVEGVLQGVRHRPQVLIKKDWYF